MARKSKHDLAKAKAAKQKKIAIGGGVVLVALLAIQGPKTLRMLSPKHPTASASAQSTATTTAATPSTGAPVSPSSLGAPTLAGSATAPVAATGATSSELVSAVPVSADPGQLQSFERFASKDPFAAQVSATGSSAGSAPGKSSSSSPSAPATSKGPTQPSSPAVPTTPPAPSAPTSAVISLNGELMSVPVDSDFPQAGATFGRVGAIFHLVSLTAKTAKVAIAGGSYADGAPSLTLKLQTPVTLQNTADGTKYTLILEPAGTPVTTATTASGGATAAPAPTAPVVPASGSGG